MLYWIDYVWSSKECVCCAFDPSKRYMFHPYVVFLYFVNYLLILDIESWITVVFSPYVVSWCVPAVAMHLTLWYVVHHQYNVCKHYVGSVYVGEYGGLS